ncbi:unnamed protein product [Caenorhabditis auriculariae]|uniref:Uncharacterized protein n=1 Tax=Caenorhabditis auriculariae TaxID=2777116 RepID=A0A8S1HPR9_9PELO|nr:unnamed protein product [Caenorhabditis auriculariae]
MNSSASLLQVDVIKVKAVLRNPHAGTFNNERSNVSDHLSDLSCNCNLIASLKAEQPTKLRAVEGVGSSLVVRKLAFGDLRSFVQLTPTTRTSIERLIRSSQWQCSLGPQCGIHLATPLRLFFGRDNKIDFDFEPAQQKLAITHSRSPDIQLAISSRGKKYFDQNFEVGRAFLVVEVSKNLQQKSRAPKLRCALELRQQTTKKAQINKNTRRESPSKTRRPILRYAFYILA